MANLYLHHVLDLWANHWRKHHAQGELVLVQYADDFVMGFEQKDDAERFLSELRERMRKSGLELHPEKTRLIEFGRFAAIKRAGRGEGKDPRTGKTVRRVWRRVLVDPTLGARRARVRRHLPLFQWSNPSLKDHLALFTHGVVGQWTLPRKTGRDYVEQMTAEVQEEREDSRGRIKVLWVQKRRDNHYLDCELMIDAAAIISEAISNGEPGRQISSQTHRSSGL